MHDAQAVRPGWEVRCLLMHQLAEIEAKRGNGPREDAGPVNPPDTPAPDWVNDLPT